MDESVEVGTMRAVRYVGRGESRLEELSIPEPAEGEILLRLRCCGLLRHRSLQARERRHRDRYRPRPRVGRQRSSAGTRSGPLPAGSENHRPSPRSLWEVFPLSAWKRDSLFDFPREPIGSRRLQRVCAGQEASRRESRPSVALRATRRGGDLHGTGCLRPQGHRQSGTSQCRFLVPAAHLGDRPRLRQHGSASFAATPRSISRHSRRHE